MNSVIDFKGILQLAKKKSASKKPRAALVVPSDVTTLKSFVKAVEMNLIEPLIIGDEKLLLDKSSANNINISNFEIFDIIEPEVAVETAMKMAVEDSIDLIVKGKFDIFSPIIKIFSNAQLSCRKS